MNASTLPTAANIPLRDYGFVILEIMGHRSFAGHAYDEHVAGGVMLRIDVMDTEGDTHVTQYYGTQSIYGITLVDEEAAKAYAAKRANNPAAILGIPRLPAPSPVHHEDDGEFEPEIDPEDEENEFDEFDTPMPDDDQFRDFYFHDTDEDDPREE